MLATIACLAASTRGVFNCVRRCHASAAEAYLLTLTATRRAWWMLQPGVHFGLPWPLETMTEIELRETSYHLPKQPAITRDNVDMEIDGVVYLRVIDPYKARVSASPPSQATRFTDLTLDQTFKNREELNAHVVEALRRVGQEWGLIVTRVIPSVKDIDPPDSIMDAMKAEAEAERRKRALVLESEGRRQAAINHAEGDKSSTVLRSEARKLAMINLSEGKASAALLAAKAAADSRQKEAEAEAEATR
ncbi:MAG: hypothetical protein SGPRY_001042 [Prymnesium sp.]